MALAPEPAQYPRSPSTPPPRQPLPPLQCVVAACRSHPTLAALAPAVALISEFVDPAAQWTVLRACQRPNAAALLRRVFVHESTTDPFANDRFYRDWVFASGVEAAAGRGDLEAVQWLCTEYAPGNEVVEGAQKAAEYDQLHVLKWLYEEYGYARVSESLVSNALRRRLLGCRALKDSSQSAAATTRQLETVQWLVNTFADRVATTSVRGDRLYGVADLWFLQWAAGKNLLRSGGQELTYAARAGRLDVVQWFARHLDGVYQHQQDSKTDSSPKLTQSNIADRPRGSDELKFPYVVEISGIASSGHLDVLQWLHTTNYLWMIIKASPVAMNLAARAGELEVVQWLHTQRVEGCTADAMDSAASCGHLSVVRWLHQHRTEGCTVKAMDGAAANGHLEIVRWLHERRDEGCTTQAMDAAAQNNHFEIVRWLHDHRSEGCTAVAMNAAALHGRLDVIQWLHASCTVEAMDAAAVEGHLEVVRWLHEQRTEGCTTQAMDWAAANGHLDIVQFLDEHRQEGCTTEAMDQAIMKNRLDIVQYLHEHRNEGCTPRAIDIAAWEGNLSMIQWLSDHDVGGFTPTAMDTAAKNGQLEVVQWLHAHRTEGCTSDAMDKAAADGHLPVVQWLHVNRSEGCTVNAMNRAAANGQLAVVQWLHHHRTEGCTTAAMNYAVAGGYFEVALFLHRHRTEGCTAEAFVSAYTRRRLDILRWLVTRYPAMFDREALLGLSDHAVVDYMQDWMRNADERVR